MVPSATNDRLAHKALLKRRDEHGSVNFTPFRPTSKYPVGLTIKSKDGENRLSPEVHLSAWQAAQWRSLCEMAGSDIKGLEFLPGIIVDGHEWKFIATTWKNGRTVCTCIPLLPHYSNILTFIDRPFCLASLLVRLPRKSVFTVSWPESSCSASGLCMSFGRGIGNFVSVWNRWSRILNPRHNQACHNQVCHSKVCHSQACHSQTCHSQTCHSRACHRVRPLMMWGVVLNLECR
jgi:hypothetical protein